MAVAEGQVGRMKLNVGSGRDAREGWLNLDLRPGPGIDIVTDLCAKWVIPPWPDWMEKYADAVDEFECSHVIEHLPDVLAAMENLWRVATPGATMTVRCPHGAADDADEDPTHVRRMFPGSFGYFGQPHYWRTTDSYGYRGDWRCDAITLTVAPDIALLSVAEASRRIMRERNCVVEMVATLVAVKPARAAEQNLIAHPTLELARR